MQEMQNAEAGGAAAPMSVDEQRHLAHSIRQEMGIRPDEDEAMRVSTAPGRSMICTSCRCIQCAACSSSMADEHLCASGGLCKDLCMPQPCSFSRDLMQES